MILKHAISSVSDSPVPADDPAVDTAPPPTGTDAEDEDDGGGGVTAAKTPVPADDPAGAPSEITGSAFSTTSAAKAVRAGDVFVQEFAEQTSPASDGRGVCAAKRFRRRVDRRARFVGRHAALSTSRQPADNAQRCRRLDARACYFFVPLPSVCSCLHVSFVFLYQDLFFYTVFGLFMLCFDFVLMFCFLVS